MQYIWHPEDVTANYGQVVNRGTNTEHYMFAYEEASGLNPCLVSMRDGMITATGLGIAGFARMLNEQKFQPFEYRRPLLEETLQANRRLR